MWEGTGLRTVMLLVFSGGVDLFYTDHYFSRCLNGDCVQQVRQQWIWPPGFILTNETSCISCCIKGNLLAIPPIKSLLKELWRAHAIVILDYTKIHTDHIACLCGDYYYQQYEYTLPAPEFKPVIEKHCVKGHSILLKPPHLSALCTLLCYLRLKSPFIDPDPVLNPVIS